MSQYTHSVHTVTQSYTAASDWYLQALPGESMPPVPSAPQKRLVTAVYRNLYPLGFNAL